MKKKIKSILLFLAFISIYPRSFFAQKMHTDGTAWFSADNTPLPASAGSGVAVGYGSAGYIFSFDYSSFSPRNLLLQSPGGNVGIGTLSPTYRLDVKGYTRAFNDSAAGFVAETTGGTNTWARYYMRSSAQSWFIGTSQNFNGNQLYIGDETNNQTRFSIQPGGGPIHMQGNIMQDLGSNGLPKAMVYLNSNGTIGRCYNGLTGATTGGCGFTSVHVNSGNYQINFPFSITSRFFAVSAEFGCCPGPVSVSYQVFSSSVLNIGVLYKQPNVINSDPSDLPVMVIVY